MIEIDGSFGEGGGQILRSSLGLSMLTGKPFHIANIRARRKKPGLLRQHLTCVNAAASICGAKVTGASLGSEDLCFDPGPVQPGDYHFAIGTAGSAMLVIQAVLPGLLTASGSSSIVVEGGTHNPYAPPYHFLERVFTPILSRMGAKVTMGIDHYGFYPKGGGRVRVEIEPASELKPLELLERGKSTDCTMHAYVSKLPLDIAKDELRIAVNSLKFQVDKGIKETVPSPGPGNVLMVELDFENVTELVSSFGEIGKSRKRVAKDLAKEANAYWESKAVASEHLADQLLIPMAMAGRGAFVTCEPTDHTLTNIEVVREYLDVIIRNEQIDDKLWKISIE